jgi:hypothetical protein
MAFSPSFFVGFIAFLGVSPRKDKYKKAVSPKTFYKEIG